MTRRCLVHSDVNPKNLLVDPGTLTVTGLLDWEFAHAGHPFTDLGNLLRFDREPAFAEAVLAAYARASRRDAGDALDLARAADLWALVDLAGRRGEPGRRAGGPAARDCRDTRRPARQDRACERPRAGAAPVGRRRARRRTLSAAPEVCLRPGPSGLSLAIRTHRPSRAASCNHRW